MPIIGIDASRAMRPEKTGVEWYAWNIIRAMAPLTPEGWAVRLYTEGKEGGRSAFPPSWSFCSLGWPPRFLWSQIRLGLETLARPPDVFFVPAHVLPFVHPARSVVTVHDVAFRTFPEAYSKKGRWYLDLTTRFAVSRATRIIVPSEATARDLRRYYGAPESRLQVIPHGPGIVTQPEARSLKHEIDGPYFVAIGRIEIKKNTARIVEGYAAAREKSETARGMKLVLVGGRGVGAEETDRAIARSGMSGHVIRTGHLPADEARAVLAGARALVFPSMAEGFGLPILDAMTLGVPVMTSTGLATEEVAGGAALLVDPQNAGQIAEGIVRLAEDGDLRSSLAEKGRVRATQFSWQKSAAETWKVIGEAAG